MREEVGVLRPWGDLRPAAACGGARFCVFRRSGFRGGFFWALMEGVSLAGVVGMMVGPRSPGISRPVPLVAGSGSARGISIAPAVDDLAAFFGLKKQGAWCRGSTETLAAYG